MSHATSCYMTKIFVYISCGFYDFHKARLLSSSQAYTKFIKLPFLSCCCCHTAMQLSYRLCTRQKPLPVGFTRIQISTPAPPHAGPCFKSPCLWGFTRIRISTSAPPHAAPPHAGPCFSKACKRTTLHAVSHQGHLSNLLKKTLVQLEEEGILFCFSSSPPYFS